jgi:hypothetical protein
MEGLVLLDQLAVLGHAGVLFRLAVDPLAQRAPVIHPHDLGVEEFLVRSGDGPLISDFRGAPTATDG